MKLDKELIEKVASLARLKLTDKEISKLLPELKEILDRQPIDQDMGRRVLDKVLENLKAISPDYHHSNRFLSGLLGYVESTSPEMVEKLKQSRQQEATSLIFPAR